MPDLSHVLRGGEALIGREITDREWALTDMPAYHPGHQLPEVARVAWIISREQVVADGGVRFRYMAPLA